MRTMPYRALLVASVLAASIPSAADAQAPASPTQVPVEAGVQNRPNHVVLQVDLAGAHLEEGQLVRFIGPINPDGDYLVIPIAPAADAASRWVSSPYTARRVMNTPSLYLLANVRVRDSSEHEDETVHPVVMNILETGSDGPISVEFWTETHEGSLGVHGGSAHLTIL